MSIISRFKYSTFPSLIAAVVTAYACSDPKTSTFEKKVERDTSIVAGNAYSDIFIDSARLENYIQQKDTPDTLASLMRSFYNSRNFQAAWFTEFGSLSEQALAFWNLHQQFINLSQDSTILDQQLHNIMDTLVAADTSFRISKQAMEATELALTEHFFQYAHYAYAGRLDPKELQWYIPRKKLDVVALLDSLIANKGQNIDQWEPVNPMYNRVKDYVKKYYELLKRDEPDSIFLGKAGTLKKGDKGVEVQQLIERLQYWGDLRVQDSLDRIDTSVAAAVKRAQKRFGFKPDGIADQRLANALNTPLKTRIEQLLVNMERMRWLPNEPSGERIQVNIPEFKMFVFSDTGLVFDMNIVVGKEGANTVVFNDLLQYVVFSPYWNIPASIVRNEIVPAMQRNPNYLAANNMEQTGTRDGLPVIRQRPGGSNALGRVKFIFPNRYNIYFHDTPAKSLFAKDKRAFSHGCIRLEQPEHLASYLLRDQPEWTTAKIRAAMKSGNEQWVTLKEPVPVFISYFTAWVDYDGQLHFREDIYGHDVKMAERMFRH